MILPFIYWILGISLFFIITMIVHEAGHAMGVRKYYKGRIVWGIDKKGLFVKVPSWFSNKEKLEVLEMGMIIGAIVPMFYFLFTFDVVGLIFLYSAYYYGLRSDREQAKILKYLVEGKKWH